MTDWLDGWYCFDNDVNSLLRAMKGDYVETGGVCTEKGTPDMSVDVAEIWYYAKGTWVYKAATNVAVGAAPGSGARKDIIVGDNAGNITCVAGAAEAVMPVGLTGPYTYQPKPPNIPTDKTLIAEVWVVTGATEIYDADITDRRIIRGAQIRKAHAVFIPASAFRIHTGSPSEGSVGGWPSWRLDDSILERVSIQLPASRGGDYNFYAYWAMESAVGGNITFSRGWKEYADGANLATAPTYSTYSAAVPGTIKYLRITDIGQLTSIVQNNLVGIVIGRDGPNASDTAAGDMHFLGLRIDYG